jgi:hypothetical protein
MSFTISFRVVSDSEEIVVAVTLPAIEGREHPRIALSIFTQGKKLKL